MGTSEQTLVQTYKLELHLFSYYLLGGVNAVTFKMELFETIIKGWKPQVILAKSSI